MRSVYLTSQKNLNGVLFTKDFITDVAENKEQYIGIPVVVDLTNLLNGNYDNLGHNLKDGKFNTRQIGSITDMEARELDNDVLELVVEMRIPKRHSEVCGALTEMYTSVDGLSFSYEIIVNEMTIKDDVKIVDKGGAELIGYCVVSMPAVPEAQCELLIAELVDLNGVEIDMDKANKFVQSANVHYVVAKLDERQVKVKLRNAFYDYIKDHTEFNDLWIDFYYVTDIFRDTFVCFDDKKGDYYQFNYDIIDDEIVVTKHAKVTKEYVETQIALAEKEEIDKVTIEELTAELEKVQAEKQTALAEKDAEIASLNEKIVSVGEELASAKNDAAELQAYKAQLDLINAEKEKAEKEKKCSALKDKAKKVLNDEEMSELAEAIEALDEATVNAAIAEKYVAVAEASKQDRQLIGSRLTDSIALSNDDDLMKKYITR